MTSAVLHSTTPPVDELDPSTEDLDFSETEPVMLTVTRSDTCRGDSAKGDVRRNRRRYTNRQRRVLTEAFDECSYLNRADRERLAATLDLTEESVQMWFRNARRREKRQSRKRLLAVSEDFPTPPSSPAWTLDMVSPAADDSSVFVFPSAPAVVQTKPVRAFPSSSMSWSAPTPFNSYSTSVETSSTDDSSWMTPSSSDTSGSYYINPPATEVSVTSPIAVSTPSEASFLHSHSIDAAASHSSFSFEKDISSDSLFSESKDLDSLGATQDGIYPPTSTPQSHYSFSPMDTRVMAMFDALAPYVTSPSHDAIEATCHRLSTCI